jgi:hypothetical protein
MKNSAFSIVILFLFVASVAIVAGCAIESESGGEPTANSSVTMAFSDLTSHTGTLRFFDLLVTGPPEDPFEPIGLRVDVDRLSGNEAPSFHLQVPSGENRRFQMTVTDRNGLIAYGGQKVVDLDPERETPIQITVYGLGSVRGTLYSIDSTTGQIGNPVADHVENIGEIPFVTSSTGRFDVRRIPVKTEGRVLSAHVNGKEAFAAVPIEQGGDRIEVDLYLMPDDSSRPWICGVYPAVASPGDAVRIFGRGFDPGYSDGPLAVIFEAEDQSILAAAVELTGTNTDFQTLVVTVPVGTESGSLYVAWAQNEVKSNSAPFEATP